MSGKGGIILKTRGLQVPDELRSIEDEPRGSCLVNIYSPTSRITLLFEEIYMGRAGFQQEPQVLGGVDGLLSIIHEPKGSNLYGKGGI